MHPAINNEVKAFSMNISVDDGAKQKESCALISIFGLYSTLYCFSIYISKQYQSH